MDYKLYTGNCDSITDFNRSDSQDSEEIEECYSSDFESVEDEIEESKGEGVIVPPLQEMNVIMTVEPPIYSLLSLIQKPTPNKIPKKPVNKKLQDKPVTFHTRIKSSGYGASSSNLKKGKKKPEKGLNRDLTYPTDSAHPSILQSENLLPEDIPLHNGPINRILYSRDAKKLASCGGDGAAFVLKLPVSKHRGDRIALVGHELPVCDISWSSTGKYTLTCSLDNTLKMWGIAGNKPGECLMNIEGSFRRCGFYYVDSFLTACQGDTVSLYKYAIKDTRQRDDIKRLQSKSDYKKVLDIRHSSAQSISAYECHNSFYSHIMLLAGSNKFISIYDINSSKELAHIPDGHKKQPHTLKFYRSTEYISSPDTEQFNIFLTAAADNSVILHDIRAPAEDLVLTGHVNTALELGADISPCQRYVISGSEDRSAYVWDVRTGKVLDRLRGFREAASDVTFNPAYPQVAVGSINGQIRFFRSNR